MDDGTKALEVIKRLDAAIESLPAGALLVDLPADTVEELWDAIIETQEEYADEADAACIYYLENEQWPPLGAMVRAVVTERLNAASGFAYCLLHGLDGHSNEKCESVAVVSIHPAVSIVKICQWLLTELPYAALRTAHLSLIGRIAGVQLRDRQLGDTRVDHN